MAATSPWNFAPSQSRSLNNSVNNPNQCLNERSLQSQNRSDSHEFPGLPTTNSKDSKDKLGNLFETPTTFSQILQKNSASTATGTTTSTQTTPFNKVPHTQSASTNANAPSASSSTNSTKPSTAKSKTSHVGTMTTVSLAEFFGPGTTNRQSDAQLCSAAVAAVRSSHPEKDRQNPLNQLNQCTATAQNAWNNRGPLKYNEVAARTLGPGGCGSVGPGNVSNTGTAITVTGSTTIGSLNSGEKEGSGNTFVGSGGLVRMGNHSSISTAPTIAAPMQQPNLSHTTQHPLPPNPALFQQLYQMGQQYSVPHTPTPLAFNVRQQQQKQRSLPTAPLIHSSSTSTTVPAPAPVNSTPLPKPSKRLSAHAQPFVPTTPLPPPPSAPFQSQPHNPSGYQSAFTPHATHRHPYAYNQSIFQQHNSFRSRDDMEGVIGFSSARRGAGKRSWTQSRHSLRNRNDEVDYYYSEDDEPAPTAPTFFGLTASPAVSYTASYAATEDGEGAEGEGDGDDMSLSSDESVEFVLDQGALSLPLFLKGGCGGAGGEKDLLEQRRRDGGVGAARSLSESPVNRGVITGGSGAERRRGSVVGAGSNVLAAVTEKRVRSISAAGMILPPPVISRGGGAAQAQPKVFKWVPTPSLNPSTTPIHQQQHRPQTLAKILTSPTGTRPGRAQRRHSHSTRAKATTGPSPRYTTTHLRRSLSISSLKPSPTSTNTSSPLDLANSLSTLTLTPQPQYGPATSVESFQTIVPATARFEFTKRFYMDLEIPWVYQEQRHRGRKTVVPRRMGRSAGGGGGREKGGVKERQVGKGEGVLLMRTASEPSLAYLPGEKGGSGGSVETVCEGEDLVGKVEGMSLDDVVETKTRMLFGGHAVGLGIHPNDGGIRFGVDGSASGAKAVE